MDNVLILPEEDMPEVVDGDDDAHNRETLPYLKGARVALIAQCLPHATVREMPAVCR